MTGFEVVLLILGIAFVVISCFIVDKSGNHDKTAVSSGLNEDELEQMISEAIERAQDETDRLVRDGEDRLENISNDKIIAVGEYSDQVLEKVGANHQEVVFLYQMLQDKEEELKSELQKIENSRVECERAIHELDRVMKEAEELKAQVKTEIRPAQEPAKTVVRQTASKPVRKTATVKTPQPAKTVQPEPVKAVDARDTMMLSKNDEIIALYKENKSVMEISKLLKMGQGEVKLIIDLYCR